MMFILTFFLNHLELICCFTIFAVLDKYYTKL